MSIVKFAGIVLASAVFAFTLLALMEWAYLRWIRPDCGLSEAEMDAQVGSEFLEPKETLEQHLAGAKKDILAEVDGMLLPPPRQNPGRFGK